MGELARGGVRSATSSASRARKRPTSNAGSPWPKPSKSRKPGREPSSRTWAGRNAPWTGAGPLLIVAGEHGQRVEQRPGVGPGALRERGGEPLEQPAGRLQLAGRRPRRAGRHPGAVQRDQPVGRLVQGRSQGRPGRGDGRIRDQVGQRPVAGKGALQERPVAGEVAQRLGETRNTPASQPALPQGTHPRVGRGAAVTAGGLGDDPPRPGRVGVRRVAQVEDERGPLPRLVAHEVGTHLLEPAAPVGRPRAAPTPAVAGPRSRPTGSGARAGRCRRPSRSRRARARGAAPPPCRGAGSTPGTGRSATRTTVRTPPAVTTSASKRSDQDRRARTSHQPDVGEIERVRDDLARSGRAAPRSPRRGPGPASARPAARPSGARRRAPAAR